MRCSVCKKVKRTREFYLQKNNRPYHICKECLEKKYGFKFISSPLCEIFDIPVLYEEWEKISQKYPGQKIFGRYLSFMKLKGYRCFTFKDTKQLNELRKKKRMFDYDERANKLVVHLDKYDLKHFLMKCWRVGTIELYDIFHSLTEEYLAERDPGLANAIEDFWGLDELEIYLRERYKINFREEIRSFMCCPNLYKKDGEK